jgi:hypothetical protein
MDGAPKRSLGDTIGQLIVILILLALIVGAIIFLRQYVDSHNTSGSPTTTTSHPVATIAPRDAGTRRTTIMIG